MYIVGRVGRAAPEETDMLVDQNDSNVFPGCKVLKRSFDGRSFRLVVDDEKVLLRFGAGGDMLCTSVRQVKYLFRRRRSYYDFEEAKELQSSICQVLLTPMPASKRPVTESYTYKPVLERLRSPISKTGCAVCSGRATCLIADYGKELPVLEVSLRCHRDGGQWAFLVLM